MGGPVIQSPTVGIAEDVVRAVGRWLPEGHREMKPTEVPTSVGSGQLGGDDRAPVAAPCPVALVAEAIHQLDERGSDASWSPTRHDCWSGKPVAGYRRRHNVERIGRVATVSRRIDQWLDHLDKFEDRARPAMNEQKRN